MVGTRPTFDLVSVGRIQSDASDIRLGVVRNVFAVAGP